MKIITRKSLISLIIALIMILNLVPFGAISKVYATEDIQNIKIESDGTISWDAVEGAVSYEYGSLTDNAYSGMRTETSGNLTGFVSGLGVSIVRITAYSNAQGSAHVAQTDVEVTYDGTTFTKGDTRTEVAEVEATSNISTLTVYGQDITIPTFNVTKGEPTYFNRVMGDWYKKDGEDWKRITGVFKEGTYCYGLQVRIDGENGLTHKITESATVKVDGEDWKISPGYVGKNYSYIIATSPEINVEKVTMDLTFNNNSSYNIKESYVNQEISSFSVIEGVIGGEEPYVFSKTSGPSWINVSSDGTISGTPTVAGENEDLTIRVTDNEGTFKEITVTVKDTLLNPEDREYVAEVEATSNIVSLPIIGKVIEMPTFNVTKGKPAYFNRVMGDWYKKDGDDWKIVTGDFEEGTYRYGLQVRIDGASGTTHKITEETTVKVDGVDWKITPGFVGNNYSYIIATSPEFQSRRLEITLDPNGGNGVTQYIPVSNYGDDWVIEVASVYEISTPACYEFAGWKIGDDIYQGGDTFTNITSDIIAVAQWRALEHTPKTTVKENEKAATCTKEGSYDEVVYCSVCSKELSRITKKVEKLVHTSKEVITPKVIKATLSKDGSIVKTIEQKCTACDKVLNKKDNTTPIPYPKEITLSKNKFTYNKKVQKPTVKVVGSDGKEISSANYNISYSNKDSKNVGEYTVTITFKGNYEGTKSLTYTINPKGTSLSKLTKGSKQFKATWKKQKTQTTGYQIEYSTNKNFKSGNKKVTVKKNKTTSTTVKKLKKNKKYYVRIRTYKTLKGTKYYSGWSKVKNVKVK